MLHLVARKQASCPFMNGNTYIQHKGGMLGQYGENEKREPDILLFDENVEFAVKNVLGDKEAKIYTV